MGDLTTPPSVREQLADLFGTYRAEWLEERVYEFFTEPEYFPELTGPGPCILVGGRGTGKTTVLRGMSYQGQWARSAGNVDAFNTSTFIGLYYRADLNHVNAFKGRGLPEADWVPLFAHYINLLLIEAGLTFLEWHLVRSAGPIALDAHTCEQLASGLNLEGVVDSNSLHREVSAGLVRFQAYINNAAPSDRPQLSMQGAPLVAFFGAVRRLTPYQGKRFFILVDEFENLLDYQQRIFNTLIKHSGESYTFKIGVKQLGWRVRTTLGGDELLRDLADYSTIDIADRLQHTFSDFAARVCNDRLRRLILPDGSRVDDVEAVFPSMSLEDEAAALGVEDALAAWRDAIQGLPSAQREYLGSLSPLRAYVLVRWADAHGESLASVIEDAMAHPQVFEVRFNNYAYAYLFTIRRGRRGIRKYYAGWPTFVLLASANIRLLLQLVDRALQDHYKEDEWITSPVPFARQTMAAQAIGRHQINDLTGLSLEGARLTKLVLGLGRVFQVMAAKPERHTPEVNQFTLRASGVELIRGADDLIHAAVTNLALLRDLGTKLAADTDTQEYDYSLHPIFAPVFEYSHRRKRKMELSDYDLLQLIAAPSKAIRSILARSERADTDVPLPDQLLLFDAYFRPDS